MLPRSMKALLSNWAHINISQSWLYIFSYTSFAHSYAADEEKSCTKSEILKNYIFEETFGRIIWNPISWFKLSIFQVKIMCIFVFMFFLLRERMEEGGGRRRRENKNYATVLYSVLMFERRISYFTSNVERMWNCVNCSICFFLLAGCSCQSNQEWRILQLMERLHTLLC